MSNIYCFLKSVVVPFNSQSCRSGLYAHGACGASSAAANKDND